MEKSQNVGTKSAFTPNFFNEKTITEFVTKFCLS